MSIDWSKAPEGAQYFGMPTPTAMEMFYKKVDGVWYFNPPETEKWLKSLINLDNPTIGMSLNPAFVDDKSAQLTKDPASTDHPYMPQVGVECEVNHGDDWIKCLYLGVDIYGNYAYQISKGDYKGEFNADSNIGNFRPIKTEREKFVDSFVSDQVISSTPSALAMMAYELYSKGYRKND